MLMVSFALNSTLSASNVSCIFTAILEQKLSTVFIRSFCLKSTHCGGCFNVAGKWGVFKVSQLVRYSVALVRNEY